MEAAEAASVAFAHLQQTVDGFHEAISVLTDGSPTIWKQTVIERSDKNSALQAYVFVKVTC